MNRDELLAATKDAGVTPREELALMTFLGMTEYNCSSLAKLLNLSRSRIYQIKAIAMYKLANPDWRLRLKRSQYEQ